MKYTLIGIGLLGMLGIGYALWDPGDITLTVPLEQSEAQASDEVDRAVVGEGTYRVRTGESTVRWAGQKPLISGYVNAGSIGISEGSIRVEREAATGSFTIAMDTLSVSETPTKPGQESALEGHLKGERWFNVEGFPTATFSILEVTPRIDSDTTFVYDVRGELTLKGETGELVFPATIFEDGEGLLRAQAAFEFDRTKWGITAGSGSFFDNLADNAIADMVALSFSLVAEPVE